MERTAQATAGEDGKRRCPWSGTTPHMIAYHDEEWGVPVHDDDVLFEFLILEGAQAGLSWATILGRRDGYRRALHGFDAARIAKYGARDVARLMGDAGIIRNRLKVEATIGNARALLELREERTLAEHLWSFVDGEPVRNRFRTAGEVPVSTAASDAMSKDLKKRGFKFVGTTILYAFMQAVGMTNDHLTSCFRHGEV